MLRHVSNPPNPWQGTAIEWLDEIPETLSSRGTKPGDDFANTPPAGPLESRTFRRPPRAGDQVGLFDAPLDHRRRQTER